MDRDELRSGWTHLTFGEMARNVAERVEPAPGDEATYVGLEHLDSGSLIVRRWGVDVPLIGTKLRMKKGDVLFARRNAYLRRVSLAPHNGLFSAHGLVLRANPKVVLPAFLPFFMQSDLFMERAKAISVGSLSPTINWRTLANEEFALPPLDEQRRMASVLIRIEVTSRALQDAHAALKTLRNSTLMHSFGQLLADPAVRRVPAGQVGEVLLGRQRAPQHEDGPSMRPYLRAANVFDGYIDTADVKSMNFSPSEYRRYSLQDGDILLVEGNSSREVVGRNAVFGDEVPGGCFQNTLLRFRPGPEVQTLYAHQYFRYCVFTGTFAAMAKQTSIAHLGAQNLAGLPIPLPSKNRQIELSRRLGAIDAASPATTNREERLRTLKARISEPFGARRDWTRPPVAT